MRRTDVIRPLLAAAAMGVVALASACDGENLFETERGPRVDARTDAEAPAVAINSPRGDTLSAKPVGDSVFVSAHLTDDVGVVSVRFFGVALRGDKDLGTDTVVSRFEQKVVALERPVADTTLTRFLLPTPDSVKETALIVVEATDTIGNVAADTVNLILGGPSVELSGVSEGQAVQAGLNMGVRAVAHDPLGIIQLRLELTGAFEAQVVLPVDPPTDSVVLDTIVPVPAGAVGPLQVVAIARNGLDVSGQDGPVTVNVIAGGAGDTLAPRLRHAETAPPRMELQDSVIVAISGSDDAQGSGVATVGYTVLGISPSRSDTVVRSDQRAFSPPRTGTLSTSFSFPVFNVDSLGLPDTLVFELTTWMRDADGNCAAAVGLDTLVSLVCATLPAGETVAAGRLGERITRTVVAGKTVLLPTGGKIMDAVVDTSRRVLLLSNLDRNRVEVFGLQSETFGTAIGVGSQPWGLTLNTCVPRAPAAGCGDTLIVANSGGVNLSNVYLGMGPTLSGAGEDKARRLLTPDVALFDVEIQEADDGSVSFDVTSIPSPEGLGFSDRPQFAARDSTGRVLYSTRVVESLNQVGTIRKVENFPGFVQPEVKLFLEHAELNKSENFWAIGHVDDMGEGSAVAILDHTPGNPNDTLLAVAEVAAAVDDMIAQGSDVLAVAGAQWNVANVGFQDTTFVSASGDGGWVAFGEGGREPFGRVVMYNAARDQVTARRPVNDLITNAGETVQGLGLNFDGTMGIVRGRREVSFFTTDLRRQGGDDLEASGGSGAVLHPLHANYPTLDNPGGGHRPDTHLAFIGSDANTVEVWDTFAFLRIGRVFIRDRIVGPLRAALPLPEDNVDAGGTPLQCVTRMVTDQTGLPIGDAVEIYQGESFGAPWPADGGGGSEDACVVLKLYGTTSAGGVVVIDVRKGDVLRDHPNR